MKWNRLALLALVLSLVGCPAPIINVLPPAAPPPVVIPPPAGLTGPVLAALYDGTTVRLWDGTNAVDWKTGTAVHGNGRKIAVGSVLYILDASGAVTSSLNLPASPAGVAVIGDPVVYTFEAISNAAAFAMDYTPPAAGGSYTRIWQDGIELGDWHANPWTYVSSFQSANGDVIAVDNIGTGSFHDINRALDYTHIAWAIPDGPLFYVPSGASPNALVIYDAAHPGGQAVTATGGNLSGWGGQPWVQFGTTWYMGNGQVWDGTHLTTYANDLQQFNNHFPPLVTAQFPAYHDAGQYPVMLSAYSDAGNIYFVETVSGALVSFTPQTGAAAFVQFLYQGDGYQTTGAALAKTLAPEIVDGTLYFHQAGTLWRRDSGSTVISAFSADQQMWVMR